MFKKGAGHSFGNCQKPVFSLGVPWYVHIYKTKLKICENLDSIVHRSCKRIMKEHPCGTKLCAFRCPMKSFWFRPGSILFEWEITSNSKTTLFQSYLRKKTTRRPWRPQPLLPPRLGIVPLQKFPIDFKIWKKKKKKMGLPSQRWITGLFFVSCGFYIWKNRNTIKNLNCITIT